MTVLVRRDGVDQLIDLRAARSHSRPKVSNDNALAEAFNSLFKAELVRNRGAWTGINGVEIAVAEYIDWFNQRQLHGELGHVPPAEYEALHAATPVSETILETS